MPLSHANKALPIEALEFVRKANDKRRHGLGNPIWDGSFNHRLIPHFTKCLKITPPAKALRDFETQQEILREAETFTSHLSSRKQCYFKRRLENVLPPIVLRCIRKIRERNINGRRAAATTSLSSVHSLDIAEKYRKRFFEMFAPNNSQLSQRTGIDLKNYNYPMPG